MGDAEALTIEGVEGGTTVLTLDDVVGDEPVMRCRLDAASTILDPLTSEAGALQHLVTPCAMLRGEQLRISSLLDWTSGAHVELPDLRTDLFRHAGW